MNRRNPRESEVGDVRGWSAPLVALLLLLLGVSEPFGYLAGCDPIRAMGRMSSASVNPLVFNQIQGIEFWASSYEFEVVAASSEVSVVPITNDVLARIKGPHTRTAAFVVPIGLGAIAGPSLYLPPLQYALCDDGSLARELGLGAGVSRFLIRIQARRPNDDREWTLRIECEI